MKNFNTIIWGIAILGGGYLFYTYAKKHFVSTRQKNLYTFHEYKSTIDASGFDDDYLQNWANAIRNKQSTFMDKGLNHDVKTGRVIK